MNRLSDQAREDAIRFARDELAETEANLRGRARELADFRHDNGIVDPAADVAGQNGLLNALQGQLAQALVDRDVMLSYAGEDDQRVMQINRRIDAINERIDAERALARRLARHRALPDVVGAYQELQVDLEFANTAYTQALAGARRRPGRGAAADALPGAAHPADARRDLALSAPAAARRPRRGCS